MEKLKITDLPSIQNMSAFTIFILFLTEIIENYAHVSRHGISFHDDVSFDVLSSVQL